MNGLFPGPARPPTRIDLRAHRGSHPSRQGKPDHAKLPGVTEPEHFKKSWRGWIRSSAGYSVRVGSRTRIDYRDSSGQIRIDSEAMSDPWFEIVVYSGSIPDTPDRPRAQVLDRLRRAFEFAGWRLTLDDAWLD